MHIWTSCFLALVLVGCSTRGKVEAEHVSHPLVGPPWGSSSDEVTLNQVSVIAEWRAGDWYAEAGLGAKVREGDFEGPWLTGTLRAGVYVW